MAKTTEAVMLILLSDGAGLTARQCATVLARAGPGREAPTVRHKKWRRPEPEPAPPPARGREDSASADPEFTQTARQARATSE